MITNISTCQSPSRRSPQRVLVAWLLSFVLAAFSAAGCAAAAGKLVGDILTDLQATVSSIVSEASTEANALLLNASTQVQNALDTTTSNVSDLLDQGYNEVNTTVQNSLNQAQAMVDDLDAKTTDQMKSAVQGAQQLVNSLPLTNKNPQVTSYTPAYVSSSSLAGDDVAVEVSGNFVHAYEQKMAPTLTYPGAAAPLEAKVLTTQQLTFFAPASLFQHQPGHTTMRRVELILDVAYQNGKIFKSIKPGQFRLAVTVLPPSPVRSLKLNNVTIKTDNPQQPPKQETQHTQPDGPAKHVYSYDCKEKDEILGPFHPRAGWAIDPGTIELHTDYTDKGDQRSSVEIISSTTSSVAVRIRTWPSCLGPISNGSGNVYVSVSYTEWYQPPKPKPTTTETAYTENITDQLTWGGTVIRGVVEGKWSLDAVLLDGTVKSYNGTDVSNPYLHVKYQQGSRTVNISAVSAEDLTIRP